MYKKITSIVLMLLVIVRSEEISANNVTQANFLNLRLSTIIPYLLHNDRNYTKDDSKRSLFLLMPPSQTRNEYKNSKEIVQKTKRCGTLPRNNRFFSLSRKANFTRAEMNARSLDRNIKIPRQNSSADTLVKNKIYLQENPVNRMKTEKRKDNTFLRALRNNMNAENLILNLKPRGKTKKCNTGNCICYCKEENCFSKSSMTDSSEILITSRKDKPEKINQRPVKYENTKSNILQQISPKLYHKNLEDSRIPSLINSFPTRFYQGGIRGVPHASILYGKKPHILPYIVGNDKNFVNVGVPFTSFENRPNFSVKSKTDYLSKYHSINHPNLCSCPRIIDENRVGSPMSITSSATSYADATTITQTESDLESIEITEKDEKKIFKLTTETPNNYIDESINSETKTNLYPNYSNDVIEESSAIDFSSTEGIKGNREEEFSELMPLFTNYIDRSRTPSIIYPSILHNDKLINMEECIKLFGRDVCVLSATSPEILAKQMQENNMNEYSTIKIPEYIIQMSTKEEATLNNVNYSDKLETINTYVQSNVESNEHVDSNEHLESTNTELNFNTDEDSSQESIESTYESDDNYDENKLFNTKEDTRISINKLMNQITDKTMETAKNTLLEKSKSHTIESLSNSINKETVNPSLNEKYLYSTNSYEYSNDQETNNLKIDQQTLMTDINVNSWSTFEVLWNTLPKEETTTISYDFKTEYNCEKENKNYLEESNINTYSGGEISQEQLKEKSTTVNHDDLNIGYNFKEEVTNKLNESKLNTFHEKEIPQGQSEEITTISYDSTAIYNFEESEESVYNLKKLNTDFDLEKEILEEQLEEKIIPINSDSNTEYNFEETTENDLLDIRTTYFRDEILREQSVMQHLEHEKTNYLNNEEDIINSPETLIDLSSKNHTIHDDNLLLNSIRKVINDFASNASLSKTKTLDENILQIQGRSLLPEILQVPNLERILSIPQIENTIVAKVKDLLSDIIVISEKNFTNDWSHDAIKNSFRGILQTLSTDFHQKLPPMTVKEHQFKDGQWTINSITLAPVPDSELSIANPENLEKSIRKLLNFSIIASQADQYIIQNMIVQSVKNSLTKDEHEEIDNSIIHMLNNILQTLKNSEEADVLKKNNRLVGNKKDVNLTFSQEISASNYEEEINIGNSILIDKQNIDIEKDTKIDNEKMQRTSYSKALENNASMIISNLPHSTEYEKDKSTDEETPKKTNILMSKIGKNVKNQTSNKIQKIDNEVKKLVELLKIVTYNKAISQNNLSISEISESKLIETEELNKTEKGIFSEANTISSIVAKNFNETEKDIISLTPIIKNINVNDDNNKSPVDYYSLEDQTVKYIKNDHINDESIQVTTISTNFVQQISPNYAQISNGINSENMEEVIGKETEYILNRNILNKLPDNLISSTNIKYRNENVASSTDEIDPAIILERIEHNLLPIKYYSPEILKYIKSHYNADASVEVSTALTSFMQETSSDYAQISDDLISQNVASAKDAEDEIESILNDKTSTTSADVISSLNVDYGNHKSEITPSTDTNILDLQQQNFMTQNNIIAKIHEATTEVQRTYAKTTYFEVKPSIDGSPKFSSSSSTYKAHANKNDDKNKNSNNNNSDNLIGKMFNFDITTETNKGIIPFSKSCCLGDIYPLQFPLLIASDNSELEKSKLYYISEGMKLPLEIRKLKDGFYELSIVKNICEQILERKCSCCMPLQGHVILSCNKNQNEENIHIMTSSQENMYVKNVKKDYYSTESPSIMITVMRGKDILRMQKSEEEEKEDKEEEEEEMSAPYHETGSHDIIQNYDKSLIKSVRKFEYDQLEKKNLNDNFEIKKAEFVNENKDATDKLQNLVNFRERKDTMSTSFSKSPIFRDFYELESSIVKSWKKNAKANQFEITEDLHELETEKNIHNINTEQKINSKNKTKNPIFKRINNSKQDTEIKNEEIKSDKYQISNIEKDVKILKNKREKEPQQTIKFENQEKSPISKIIISGNKVNMKSEEINWDKLTDIEKGNISHKKEKKEHKICMIDDKQNDSKIKIFEDNKKPYRYQRNTNGIVNKRAEIVKSMLYWLKGFFSDK
ncbi:hypothetical protein ACFW04_001019 [Cataglyphis niger]